MRFPSAESLMTTSRRRSRVSSLIAPVTHWVTSLRYPGGYVRKNVHAALLALNRRSSAPSNAAGAF